MSNKITKQQLLEYFITINKSCKESYCTPLVLERIVFQIVWSNLEEDLEILSFYFDSFNLTVEDILEHMEENKGK